MSTNRTLDSVLEAIVLSGERPTKEAMGKWLTRYPEFREDIVEFVSEWQRQEALPDADVRFDAAAAAAAAHVRTGVRKELARRDEAKDFLGIFAQAQALGLKLEDEATGLGVNVQLLDLIDRKRVIIDTIPKKLIAALSSRLHVSARRLTTWLGEATPSFVASAHLGSRSFKAPLLMVPFDKACKQSGLSARAIERWTVAGKRLES